MGGARSKCWLCKDPNGIVEQRGLESTFRLGAFLRYVTPDRRPGDYQNAACRILNGIAKRSETTLQNLPSGTPGKAQALAALQAFKKAVKDETLGTPLRERLPSASMAKENDFDLTSTKVFLTPPPPVPKSICGLPQRPCPLGEDPWRTSIMGCCACHGKIHSGFV